MAGLSLDTALTGSVVGGLYPNTGRGSAPGAARPTRTMIPEGPTTVAGAAFGPGAAGPSGQTNAGSHVAWAGVVAAGLLAAIWWMLPR